MGIHSHLDGVSECTTIHTKGERKRNSETERQRRKGRRGY
uniref:Uncharacterized protein n=1 Tax=Anguilla anguilla TaxID=7936 RepID=A0A0E9U1Y8_ANGAN